MPEVKDVDDIDTDDEFDEEEGEGEIEDNPRNVLQVKQTANPAMVIKQQVAVSPAAKQPPCNVQNVKCQQPQFVNEFP